MGLRTKKIAWVVLPLLIVTIGIIYFRSQPMPSSLSSYDTLQITEIKWVDHTILISGKTNLPDGSILGITFDKWDSSDEETNAAIDQNATVEDGAFYAQFSLVDRALLQHGPYKISLLFSPRSQPDTVLEKVGTDGDYLNGPLVKDHDLGFKTLELVAREESKQ